MKKARTAIAAVIVAGTAIAVMGCQSSNPGPATQAPAIATTSAPARAGSGTSQAAAAPATTAPSTAPSQRVANELTEKLRAAFPKATMGSASGDSFYDNLPAVDRPKFEGDLTGAPKGNSVESADVYTAPLPDYSGWNGVNDAVITGSTGGVNWVVSVTSDVQGWPVSPQSVARAVGGKLIFQGSS